MSSIMFSFVLNKTRKLFRSHRASTEQNVEKCQGDPQPNRSKYMLKAAALFTFKCMFWNRLSARNLIEVYFISL